MRRLLRVAFDMPPHRPAFSLGDPSNSSSSRGTCARDFGNMCSRLHGVEAATSTEVLINKIMATIRPCLPSPRSFHPRHCMFPRRITLIVWHKGVRGQEVIGGGIRRHWENTAGDGGGGSGGGVGGWGVTFRLTIKWRRDVSSCFKSKLDRAHQPLSVLAGLHSTFAAN